MIRPYPVYNPVMTTPRQACKPKLPMPGKVALARFRQTVYANSAMKSLDKSVILVGMMGAGKTSVGRRLAAMLGVPFRDADSEIEEAAGCTVSEIFERFGEPAFREGERKVIARLLGEAPHVLATGGGAFMDPDTRARIKQSAISIWLKADIELLLERVGRKDTRPLLRTHDRRATLQALLASREPVYAEADITVISDAGPQETVVKRVLAALEEYVGAKT
jgi:shikimate kinase